MGSDNVNIEEVNHPSHYNIGIEVIEFLESWNMVRDFCLGNIIKYVMRYEHKRGLNDLHKAKFYLDYLISYQYKEDANTTCGELDSRKKNEGIHPLAFLQTWHEQSVSHRSRVIMYLISYKTSLNQYTLLSALESLTHLIDSVENLEKVLPQP